MEAWRTAVKNPIPSELKSPKAPQVGASAQAAQSFQAVKTGYDHNAQNRQNDRRSQKTRHSGQRIASRVLPQKGRKNQISRAEKQRKQHNAYHQ